MFPTRLVSFVAALLLTLSLAPDLHAQRGALTAPINLANMTREADVIVRGSVMTATVERHPHFPGLSTLLVTLKVHETLKGPATATFTFRQFIWDLRDRLDAAGYRKGQQWLLMLNRANDLGLTSPIGMEQGRFRITRDGGGNLAAINGQANVHLFSGMKSPAATSASKQVAPSTGAVPLEVLTRLVKQLTGNK